MSFGSRVAWREGQFLRPQHFQQADRAAAWQMRVRAEGLRPYPWGLTQIAIDEDLAAVGKFTVVRASGIMPDGTAFSIPDDMPPPPPLDVPPDTRDATIYLTLRAAQAVYIASTRAAPACSGFAIVVLSIPNRSTGRSVTSRLPFAPRMSARSANA